MKLTDEQKNTIYEKEAKKRATIVKQAINCQGAFNKMIIGSAALTAGFGLVAATFDNNPDFIASAGLSALLGVIGVGGRLYSSRKEAKGKKSLAELMTDWKDAKLENSSYENYEEKYVDYTSCYVVGDHTRFDPYAAEENDGMEM